MAGFGGSVKLTGESEYRKALKDITSNLRLVTSELKLTNSEFMSGDKSIKDAKASYELMNKTMQEQKIKVNELREALVKAEKEYGSNNETVRSLKTQLNNAEGQLRQMEDATNKSTKELKEMKKGMDDAGQGAITLGDLIKSNLISEAISSGFKGIVSAVKSVGSAMLDVGKNAIESYAEYEQLVGGVETLFKDSSNVVQNYANNAYKTAGLSANEYMSTVTSFSASLLQSLNGDTAKSAEVADMAITDMADNANKMGTSMESIQTAYQGFAKQNYTMLDNLKLGYGGTKTEMQRLLADATAISGIKYDINNLNDVYQAIHVIQGELGITGTTAKEASSTISGSVFAVKSAWQNLLTGVADDNADFSGLINNFVESIAVAGENLIPRIGVVIDGLSQLVVKLAEKLVQQLPTLLTTGQNMLQTLINGVVSMMPSLMPMVVNLVNTLSNFIVSNLPTIIDVGIQLLLSLVQGISQSLPELIPAVIDAVITITENLLDNIDLIIDAGIELVLGLASGLIEALPKLVDKIPIIIDKLIVAITNNWPKIINAGITLVVKLASGLIKAIPQLVSKIPEIISSLVSGFGNYVKNMANVGLNLVKGIWDGISNSLQWIKDKIKGWVGNVTNFIKKLFGINSPSKLMQDEVGVYLAEGIGVGFEDGMKDVNKNIQNSIPTEFDVGVKTSISSISSNKNSIASQSALFANAVKSALTGMHVVLDGDKLGEVVISNVEEVIYS